MAGQPVCTFEDRLTSGLNAAQDVSQGGHSHDTGSTEHAHGHGHDHGPDEHGHTHEHLENAGESFCFLRGQGNSRVVADASWG